MASNNQKKKKQQTGTYFFIYIYKEFILYGVYLTYNVSGANQGGSVIDAYTYIAFEIIFPTISSLQRYWV